MFVICFGAQKTGSTLCFQLISALLEARGHEQAGIPSGAVEDGRVQHFAPKNWSADPAWLALLASHATDPRLYAIKFHGPCTPELAGLIDEGKVTAIVNTRDPRDVALALRDTGRRKSSGAFSRINGIGDAIKRARAGAKVTQAWLRKSEFVADYEQVAFDTTTFLKRASQKLQLEEPGEEESRKLYSRASDATTTRNVMRSRRFMHEWTSAQAAIYSELLEGELEIISSFPASTAAGINYPFLKSPPAPNIITERTFVVLGCPRGGTSLLSGALNATGIYMGETATAQYEDKAFKVPLADVRRDPNIEARLLPVIQERNRRHRFWGWKLPNNIYYIQQIRHLLVNPVFIFVYRDENAIARSSAKHDGKAWWLHRRRLIKVARNHTQLVRNFEATLGENDSKATFHLEEVQKNIPAFLDEFAKLVPSDLFDREAVGSFVNPEGGYVPWRARA